MCVNGVVTQGRNDYGQVVTSYKLSYSTDGTTFTELSQVFAGNDDQHSRKTNSFDAVQARYVGFYPQTWNGHMSMRAGVIAGHIATAQGIF